MVIRIVTFASALFAAYAVTLKQVIPNEADLHVKTDKKKKVKAVAKRAVQSEGETIVLNADEILNPKKEGHSAKEGHPVTQTLRSDEGMAYYGEIRIGGQPQQGIYDTGSFDLVVLSACTKNQDPVNKKTMEAQCCSREKCPKANYNSVLSGNWAKDKNSGLEKITYGSGPVTASSGYDHVEFRSADGKSNISDVDVPTKVIVDHHIDLFRETDLQAIVGIGPGKFEEREKRMLHHLQMKRFMVCFNQDPQKNGYITWNDKDRSQDPAFVSVPALGKLFWATKLIEFKLKHKSDSGIPTAAGTLNACEPSCGAIIDTGTSLLTPPKEVIDEISKMLDEGHIKDCSDMSKFPTLSFKLGEHELSLPPEAYIGAVDDQVAGFKHEALAFPLLPVNLGAEKKLNHTYALKQQGKQEDQFPVHGACAIMMSEGDPSDNTPWGPMVIFGMQLFRKYAIQFDLAGDIDGIKPSLSKPTRIMRFTEAAADCGKDSQGKAFNFRQQRTLEGSKLRMLNLKKIRKSSFQHHLEKSRVDANYKVAGYQFRYKKILRL